MPSNYSAPPTLADDISNLTISNFAGSAVQLSSEAFTDSNTVIQTAAAVDDRIESKGFVTSSTANSTFAPINNPTFTGTVTTPNHSNVDTVLTSVAAKAPKASPTFTGTVAIPGFADVATTLSGVATNAAAITALTNGAPDLLNTLDELAAAINDDENFAATITAQIAAKADASGGTFAGTPNLSQGFAIAGTTVTATAAELNLMDGVTATTAELNILDGVTATAAELNIMDGVTVSTSDINRVAGTTSSTAELNILDGVTATSAEINKVAGLTATAAELNIMDGVTATTGEINILDGATITTAELNKLDGFTGSASDLNFAKDLAATGVSASELDILDGNTSASSTTVAAGDRLVYNDDGTMKQVAISDLVTFLNDASVLTIAGAGSPSAAISGLTASVSELNLMDGVTATTAELNYIDGVTSSIQTQLNAKAALAGATFTGAVNIPADSLQIAGTAITATAAELNLIDGVTASTGEINKLAGLTATTAELNYTDGVTSNIQTQLNAKIGTANPTFTGVVTIPAPSGSAGLKIGTTAVTATAAELNILDGVTSSTGEINVLDGLTATTSELNVLASLTATTAELNILDGATLSTNELNVLDGMLASTAELSIMDGVTATTAEINILDGDTSATSTTIATADRLVYNDDGTMKQVAISDLVTFLNDSSVLDNVGGGGSTVTATNTFGTDNRLIRSDGTGRGLQSTGITIADTSNNMSGIGTIGSGAITSSGSVTATGFTIGSAAINEAELEILDGATVTTAELNILDGATVTTAELNILDGVTSTAAELNILDGVTSTAAELNILDGVTSTAAELNILDGVTATTAELNILDGVTSTAAELNYLDNDDLTAADLTKLAAITATAAEINHMGGVTSAVQTQLNAKAPLATPTFTTSITIGNATISEAELEIIDGATVTTAELNILDGDTSATSTTIATADRLVYNDDGTMKQVAISDLVTFLNDSSVLTDVGSSVATSLVSLSGVSSGSTHLGTFTGSTIADNQTVKQALQSNETAIELRAPIANPTFTGEIGIGSVNVSETELGILEGLTATTAELNKMDGVTATTAQLNILSGKSLITSSDSFSDSDSALLTSAATKDIITGGAVLSALKFSNSANNLISSTAVSGTDTAGKNLTLAAGQGTGTGAGGSIVLQVAGAAGSSGTSANSLATAVTISSDKAVALEGALTVGGDLTVNGTTTTVSTTNTLIADKLITLNDGGGAGSGTATGLEIEENGSATGFFKTDGTGDWTLKGAGSAANAVLTLDVNATKTITVGGALSIEADSVINQDLSTDATPQFSSVTADLTGNVTGNVSGTAATVTGAAQTNITSLGTLTALTVDDVAIDGKVITMTGDTDDTVTMTAAANGAFTITTTDTAATAGDITLDADGDIVLDTAGTDIILKNAGTAFGRFKRANSDFVIKSETADKHILFKGVDDSTTITALDLDMENAGAATFNSTVTATGFTIGSAAITEAELEILDGATVTTAELNILDGVTATAAELNILDGVTATAAELNILDGVTATAAELNILDGVTSTAAEINLLDAGTAGSSVGLATGDALIIGDASASNATKKVLISDLVSLMNDTTVMTNLGGSGTVTVSDSTANTDFPVIFHNESSGALHDDTGAFRYNPSTGLVIAPTLSLGGTTITSTAAELNILDGVTATTAELNILDGVTATAAELNILDGVTATATELNLMDGVTATTAELNYVDGVTSAIQTQLDSKLTSGAQTGITTDYNTGRKIGRDADNQIDFSTDDEMRFRVGGANQIKIINNALLPFGGDDDIDIGASDNEFKDGYFDGTLHADAINFNGTAISATAAEINYLDNDNLTAADLTKLAALTATAAELNIMDGVTATTGEINILDGVTATTTELNIMDGVTATTAELNYLDDDDLTAADLTKLAAITATAAELNIMDGVTSTTAELNILDGVTATAAELNIMDGVTSTTAELNILDGVTATAAEINLIDGGTARGTTAVASGDGFLHNDGGTMRMTNVSKLAERFAGTGLSASDGVISVGTLNQDTTGNADSATLATTVTVSNSTANTNFPVVFHNESNGLLDDTGALRYNPSTGELLVPKLTVAGTTTTVDTVTMQAANAIVFEGATADQHETTLSIVDPTADHTYYLPDLGGTADTGYIAAFAADPSTTGLITATPAELNIMDGVTATTAELNILDGVTATAAELNILDGVTATASELNKMDGVTASTAELNIMDGVTATTAEINLIDGGTARGTTAVASGDGFLHNDAGTMRMTKIDKLADLFAGTGLTASNGVLSVTGGEAGTVTVADSTANTNFPVVFHDESNGLLDDTGAFRYNPSTGLVIAPSLSLGGTTITSSATELNLLDGVTATTSELNILDGVTATAAEINYLDNDNLTAADLTKLAALTATAAEINIMDGVTATTAELNYLDDDDLTAADLTKLAAITATAAELNYLDNDNLTAADLTKLAALTATAAELNYVDGVTSAIQTQLNAKLTTGAQTGITSILNNSLKLGYGASDAYITFATDDHIDFHIDNTLQVRLSDGVLRPASGSGGTNPVALGASTKDWTDVHTAALTLGGVSVNTVQVSSASFSDDDTSLMTSAALNDRFHQLNADTTGSAATLTTARNIGGVAFDGSANIDLPGVNAAGNQNTTGRAAGLDAADDRDLAPEDLSYANDFNVFFTSKEGLEDGSTTSGGNYQDAIVLNTWSDASGGDANLLAFDKSEMKIYHYQADQDDTNWGTAKTIAYTDSTVAKVTVTDSNANSNLDMVFTDGSNALLEDNGAFYYNPSTGTLRVPNLSVSGTTTTVDTVTMNAANAIVFEGATANAHETTLSIVDPTADHTYYLPDLGSTADTGYIAAFAANPGTTGLITATPAELNIMDGGNSDAFSVSGALANADRIVVNDGGTMKQVAMSHVATYIGTVSPSTFTLSDITDQTDLGAAPSSADTFVINDSSATALREMTVGNLQTYMQNNLTFSAVNVADSDTDTAFPVVFHNESNGLLDDTGAARFNYNPNSGLVNIPSLSLGGAAVTSTAAELNILDGVTATAAELNKLDGVTATSSELNTMAGITATTSEINNTCNGSTSASNITIATTDKMVVNDAGAMKQVAMTKVEAYMATYLSAANGGPFLPMVNGGSPGDKDIPTFDANGDLNPTAGFSMKQTHDTSEGLIMQGQVLSGGSDIEAYSRTDSTNKLFTVTVPNFKNAEEEVALIQGVAETNANYVRIGGGTSTFNSATTIQFFAGANQTTATGTQQADITSSGLRIGTGARVTTILDEDNMSTNSATALATQQSIKAYVDANSGGSATTINNNADNRVITGSGTSNTLNGEANFTYNGTTLTVSGGNGDAVLSLEADADNSGELDQPYMQFVLDGGTTHSSIGHSSDVFHDDNTDNNTLIIANSVATNDSGSGIVLKTGESAGHENAVDRLRIGPSGAVEFDTSTFEIDASGDITLDAGGDQIYFKDGGSTRFTFNLDSTPELDVTGAFTIDCSADITLDAGGDQIYFKDGGSTRFTFNLDSTPELDVTGDFKIDGTGDITLDCAANSEIIIQENGGTYTPTADNHVATKKYVDDNAGGGGSDTNTFVIVGEESDSYITTTAAAGNANGYQFSYGNGAQNTTKSSSGSDFGVVLPVACTLSRIDVTFGNHGSETNSNSQTFTVFKNRSASTTTMSFNASGSGGNAFVKSFSSLSGDGLSYSAGDTFNLRTTELSGYTDTQIGPARMTAYFTVA